MARNDEDGGKPQDQDGENPFGFAAFDGGEPRAARAAAPAPLAAFGIHDPAPVIESEIRVAVRLARNRGGATTVGVKVTCDEHCDSRREALVAAALVILDNLRTTQ